tara:strand:+ start:2439 stop:3968 length:1530 start_codon:yes stop_codon:yes gene_type:complete
MKIEFLGHAGICIKTNNSKIVMDGWFTKNGAFDGAWYQFPENHDYMKRDWSDITAAIVSHEHMDHLDPEFLSILPENVPIFIPNYPSPNFQKKIKSLINKEPIILSLEQPHKIGDIECQIWTEESPMNQDSIWVFKSENQSIVNTVDSRVSLAQVQSMKNFIGKNPDLLLIQCSGASWFPITYSQYDEKTKIKMSEEKCESKLNYVLTTSNLFQPNYLAINAGPPAFLDQEIFDANSNATFPNPNFSKKWLLKNGFMNKIHDPMPGDIIDLSQNEILLDDKIRKNFSWEDTSEYLFKYSKKMESTIEAIKERIEKIPGSNLGDKLKEHFEKMFKINSYFNERINMSILFDIKGTDGGKWLVNFSQNSHFKNYEDGDNFDYKYVFDSKWLKRILYQNLPWEDFFLSLRFESWRNPDIYNDHLLGLLKFNDESATHAVQQFEKPKSNETIFVTTSDGQKYEIDKFCPHAGASLETAKIKDKKIECSLHHYVFDLETGRCVNANCSLKTKKC